MLSFRGGVPGRRGPFRLNTRAGPPPPDQIPVRCYPLEANYLGGDAPPNRIPERGALPQGKYQGGVIASRSSTCTWPYHSHRIPGRRYPLKAKFRGRATHPDQIPEIGWPPYVPNTRTVLSIRSEIPGCAIPFRLNTCTGPPPSGQTRGRRFPLKAEYQEEGTFQIKY